MTAPESTVNPAMNPTAIDDAANRIFAARRLAIPLAPLPPSSRPATVAQGYEVQDALHRKQLAGGRSQLAGWKIGCTSKVLQELLQIPYPAAGGILAENILQSGASRPLARFIHVGIECEIAVELGDDLPADGAPWTRSRVADRVAACMAAIEVVDNRYTDFKAVGAPTLIADDFFQAAVVLGTRFETWRDADLAALSAATVIDGQEVGRGRGADIMGHPLEPLAWLANTGAERGRGLRRGDIILTGSMVAVQWLQQPCVARIENTAFGSVEITLSAEAGDSLP